MRKVLRPADRPPRQRHQRGGVHRKDGTNDHEVIAAEARVEQRQPLCLSDMRLARGHFDHRLRRIGTAGPHLHATFSWAKYPFSRATHRSAYSTLGTQPRAKMRSRRFKDLQELSHGSEAASAAPWRTKLLRLHWGGAAPGMCSIEFNMTGLSAGIACNLRACSNTELSALLRSVLDLCS